MISGNESLRVLVCHPGRQHSHQLAIALAEHGMLALYVTGVPASAGAGGIALRHFLRGVIDQYALAIEPDLIAHNFVAPVVRRVASSLLTKRDAIDWTHRAEGWFDRLAARKLAKVKPKIVVCYENGALHTFRAAKRLGAVTILDAASFHHQWQDRHFNPMEAPAAHRRITRRKDAEIALADYILTVSNYARQSYVHAGVDAKKVFSIPVGVDTQCFKLGGDSPDQTGTTRFVFVGHPTDLKGIDVLLEAFRNVRASHPAVTLTIIGGAAGSAGYEHPLGVRKMGRIGHGELARQLPQHDVLVLPSRFDAFGMVVAEGMACGLPAIVTENVGAREMVIEGQTGHVVPVQDAQALADAMRWYVHNRSRKFLWQQATRAMSEKYDWGVYRTRVVQFIQSIDEGTGNNALFSKASSHD